MAEENKKIIKKRTLFQKIVNVFLYIGIGIIILLLAFLGFSQTSTFREYLRSTVVEKANEALNGKISIGKIDGTILTSLVLRNTAVSMGNDTLLKAGIIELKTSPLQIFWKRIYIRKFELTDTKINFIKDSTGILNIVKLFPPSQADTSHSKFPFKIIAPDIKLTNVDFSLTNYDKPAIYRKYDNLNLNDLKVIDVNLSLSASANMKEDEYELKIEKMSFRPNLNGFKLSSLEGDFLVNKKGVFVNDLRITTDSSNIKLQAKAEGLNVFDTVSSGNINRAHLNISLNADRFCFSDLSSFIGSTNMLKGTAGVQLNAEGTFNDLNINKLRLAYLNTKLNLKAKIHRLDNVNSMVINADFENSVINEEDIGKLLPGYSIPVFKDLGEIKIDTLRFDGNPLNFTSVLAISIKNGFAQFNCGMDFTKKDIIYNIKYSTKNFDLFPLIGLPSIITSSGSIQGKGTAPDNLNAGISFLATRSTFKGNHIDSLAFNADAKNKIINYSVSLKSLISKIGLKGKFDFNDIKEPSYELKGTVKELNLATITPDTSMNSNLNFRIDAIGSNFDPEKLNLFLNIHLDKSQINSINIDSARTIVDLRSNYNGERIINIISDLADITFEGNFSFKQSADFLSREINILTGAIKEKENQIFHPDSIYYNQLRTGVAKLITPPEKTREFVPEKIKYLVEFKNFDLLSLLLANSHLRLNGNVSGEINSSPDSVKISLNTKFDYIKYWSEKNVFFLSNLDLKMELANNLEDSSFTNISSSVHITTDRLFIGSDFHNIYADLNLNNGIVKLNLSAQLEDYFKAEVDGNIDLSSGSIKTNFDKFGFAYNNLDFINKGNIIAQYSPGKIDVENFLLIHNGSNIKIKGYLVQKGEQDLRINISDLRGKDLSTNIMKSAEENSLNAYVNMACIIKGNFEAPLINLSISADSISFRNTNFGYIRSNFNYAEKNLNVDLKFLDTNIYGTPLVISGNIPIDLSFNPITERIPSSDNLNVSLKASNFNLGALGNLVPMIYRLRGDLNADIMIKGSLKNIDPSGKVAITKADFISEANNLEYTGGLKLILENQKITLDSLVIANISGTKGGGTISGSGSAELKNYELASASAQFNGSLKILSDASKSVSPLVYGDLVIATDGNIEITSNGTRTYINAPILVKDARLTFPPSQSTYQNSAYNFIYKYESPFLTADTNELDFENLIKLAKANETKDSEDIKEKPLSLDYVVNIKVQDEAILKFILAKELNQNLTAILKGNFQYVNIGGKANAQGELSLLEGSTLEFLKTFDASGTIRFESELSNPYLDIVATYKNYYTPPDAEGKEEQVAVKVKLNGPLKDLSKNFIQEKNNIAVYIGADNITNDKPDQTKDVSDAVMFILTGKFASELTPQQQSQAVAQSGVNTSGAFTSTATSLAGSLLGSFLNHYLGDYVRGVELRSVGSTTKFNLIGKVKEFRYTIGGSTDVFQDLSQANVKIEYPIFNNFLLRIERKDAITQTTTSNDMINELGLKYKFEF